MVLPELGNSKSAKFNAMDGTRIRKGDVGEAGPV